MNAWRGEEWVLIPVSNMLPGDLVSLRSRVAAAGEKKGKSGRGKVTYTTRDAFLYSSLCKRAVFFASTVLLFCIVYTYRTEMRGAGHERGEISDASIYSTTFDLTARLIHILRERAARSKSKPSLLFSPRILCGVATAPTTAGGREVEKKKL